MKTLNGYKALARIPMAGDTIYSCRWQCFATVRELDNGDVVFFHPTLKLYENVDDDCILVEKSHQHKLLVHDHGKHKIETQLR